MSLPTIVSMATQKKVLSPVYILDFVLSLVILNNKFITLIVEIPATIAEDISVSIRIFWTAYEKIFVGFLIFDPVVATPRLSHKYKLLAIPVNVVPSCEDMAVAGRIYVATDKEMPPIVHMFDNITPPWMIRNKISFEMLVLSPSHFSPCLHTIIMALEWITCATRRGWISIRTAVMAIESICAIAVRITITLTHSKSFRRLVSRIF
mmetsp:Transcript_8692/g.13119  ORF Transcript_8692/g.13119 Transcript_8692/m.13119 type:complete len:207 (-) Transcript_8692:489-1109(-)